MKLSELKINPNNPRLIKDVKFKKLCNSIKEFPKMMELRPIVIDSDNIILGGNMRFKALQELGYTDIDEKWVKKAEDLTEDEKKQFIVKDNVSFGEWDWDILANNWDNTELDEWGAINMGMSENIDKVNNLEDKEWVGMPEFDAKDTSLKIVISFDTEEDRKEFVDKYNIRIREKGSITWSTWYPYKETRDLKGLKYEYKK